jgi:hypothetical protein
VPPRRNGTDIPDFFVFPPEAAAMGVALRLTLANQVIDFKLEDMPAICI